MCLGVCVRVCIVYWASSSKVTCHRVSVAIEQDREREKREIWRSRSKLLHLCYMTGVVLRLVWNCAMRPQRTLPLTLICQHHHLPHNTHLELETEVDWEQLVSRQAVVQWFFLSERKWEKERGRCEGRERETGKGLSLQQKASCRGMTRIERKRWKNADVEGRDGG